MVRVVRSLAWTIDLFGEVVRNVMSNTCFAKSVVVENKIFATPNTPRVKLIADKDARYKPKAKFGQGADFGSRRLQIVDPKSKSDQWIFEFCIEAQFIKCFLISFIRNFSRNEAKGI